MIMIIIVIIYLFIYLFIFYLFIGGYDKRSNILAGKNCGVKNAGKII